MRRVVPLLAGIAAVGVALPFLIGVGPATLVFLVPVFGALAVVALVGSRRPAVVERGWSGATGGVVAGGFATTGPIRQARPPARKVAAALARVEARDLATSPWFGVGVGFLVVCFLLFGVVFANDNASSWAGMVDMAPWLAHPMVGMVVIAAHAGVTRAERDGTDELFDTCPAAPTTRTWGSLGSGWVPVAALTLFGLVLGVTVALRSPNLYGTPEIDAVAQLLSALVLGFGGVALGVALGRWTRFALAPVIAVVAIGFCSLRLATAGDPGWNPLQQLSTFPPVSASAPIFRDPPAWSHLAWVVGLTTAVVVVAVARHRRDRVVAVAGLGACLVLAASGVAATRPMPEASAASIADRIARPADHQVCRTAGAVQVCVYTGHEEILGRALPEVSPVAAMLPGAVPPIILRQTYQGGIGDLPPEVRRRLPQGVPPVAQSEAPLGYDFSRKELRVTRFVVGLQAVGLPVRAGPDQHPLVVAGQARGVVALWLALRDLDAGTVGSLTGGASGHDVAGRQPDAFDRGYAWPAGCSTPPVVWSAQDLRAVRALTALPDDALRAVVHSQWQRWLDPATGTDSLLAAAGLPPVGPFEAVQTRKVDPPC